ncbi:CBS domain-containing protein, partial [Acidiphilium sp.]
DEVRRDLPLRAMIAGREVTTAAPDEMADTIAVRMLTRNAPRIPVVDAEGRLLGIVSRADLLRVHQRVMLAETRRERFFPFRRRAAAKEAQKPEPLAVP